MENKRKKLSTKEEHNYKMLIAGKERSLPVINFTISPFGGEKTISANEYKRIYSVVSNEILADLAAPLLIEELELLRKNFDVTQSEVARVLKIDESTVSKWRKQQGSLENGNSRLLKEFFISKLVKKPEQKELFASIVLVIDGESYPVSIGGDVVADVSEVIVNAAALHEQSFARES